MKLSEKIVQLRKEQGLSQEELAERLGLSRQAVSRWESGTALPDAGNLLQLSRLFDVTADYLLDEERESPEAPTVANAAKPHRTNGRLIAGGTMAMLGFWGNVIIYIASRRDEQNRRQEQPANTVNGNQKSFGHLKGAKTIAR